MSDTKNLKKLGSKKTEYKFSKDASLLEVFDNQHKNNLYIIPIEAFEGTSLCPKTKQPDFFKIYINYVPDKKCVESKSLKLYIFSFRNEGSFMEDITNTIAKDLFDILQPRYLQVYADFNSRGGIYLRPFVELWSEKVDKNEITSLLNRYYALKSKLC